jgi:formylglycine-generating enzyme required for sulfatase activity
MRQRENKITKVNARMRDQRRGIRWSLYLFMGFMCVVFLLATSAHAATVQGKVISIKGDAIELDIGSGTGIKEGDTGRIYYTVKATGELKLEPVYVARFKVTNISPNSSMAKIEEKTIDIIRVGYFVEVTSQGAAQGPASQQAVKKGSQPGEVWREPSLGMEFVWVPGGCYEMGCGSWTSDCDNDEKPVHTVCVDGFWIGKFEVTQSQWQKLMGDKPSGFKDCGDNCPVEQISWNEAQEFARRFSQGAGYMFRLPTEAEWEYACRSGGKKEKYSGGDTVGAVAWYKDNSGDRPHPVGQKRSNGLGIYDMSGNVWEWCSDWGSSDYSSGSPSPRNNPQGPASGTDRVLRGGSWFSAAWDMRSTARNGNFRGVRNYSIGFRLVGSGRQ